MTPSRQERIGRHEIAIFSDPRGSLVRIVWIGDVSPEEARAVADVYASCAETGSIFVTDLSRLGKMPFASIRALASADAPVDEHPRHFRLGFAAANLRTKVIVSIITRAGAFTSRDRVDSVFFDSLEDAMAWGRAELGKP